MVMEFITLSMIAWIDGKFNYLHQNARRKSSRFMNFFFFPFGYDVTCWFDGSDLDILQYTFDF